MNGIKRAIQAEPTLLITVIRYGMLVLVVFGLDLTEEQMIVVLTFVEALLTFANRAMVTPVTKAEAQVQDAKEETRAEMIVQQAMSPQMRPDPTPEEWASIQELRRERDELLIERRREMQG